MNLRGLWGQGEAGRFRGSESELSRRTKRNLVAEHDRAARVIKSLNHHEEHQAAQRVIARSDCACWLFLGASRPSDLAGDTQCEMTRAGCLARFVVQPCLLFFFRLDKKRGAARAPLSAPRPVQAGIFTFRLAASKSRFI